MRVKQNDVLRVCCRAAAASARRAVDFNLRRFSRWETGIFLAALWAWLLVSSRRIIRTDRSADRSFCGGRRFGFVGRLIGQSSPTRWGKRWWSTIVQGRVAGRHPDRRECRPGRIYAAARRFGFHHQHRVLQGPEIRRVEKLRPFRWWPRLTFCRRGLPTAASRIRRGGEGAAGNLRSVGGQWQRHALPGGLPSARRHQHDSRALQERRSRDVRRGRRQIQRRSRRRQSACHS